ncbi:MAG: hypothetical protein ACLR8U_14855 [Oscillospiraceae bacterium]
MAAQKSGKAPKKSGTDWRWIITIFVITVCISAGDEPDFNQFARKRDARRFVCDFDQASLPSALCLISSALP